MERYLFNEAYREAKKMEKYAREIQEKQGKTGKLTADNHKNAANKIESEAIYEAITSVSTLLPELNTKDLEPYLFLEMSNSQEYKKLLPRIRDYDAAFINHFYWDEDPKISKSFELLRGQTVIDLGAGAHPGGYLVADRAGAKSYIAVEPSDNAFSLAKYIASVKNPKQVRLGDFFRFRTVHSVNGIPAAVVMEDMLSFLKRVPDTTNTSISIICSGIDYHVMPDTTYRHKVAQEILRVLSSSGVYIGDESCGHIELPYPYPKDMDYSSVSSEEEHKIAVYKKRLKG